MTNRVVCCDILTLEELYKYKDHISSMGTTWAVKLDDSGKDDIVWWCEGNATYGRAIRPCLRMEDCDLPVDMDVKWFGLTWTHIGDGIFLCEYAIAYWNKPALTYAEVFEFTNNWWKNH